METSYEFNNNIRQSSINFLRKEIWYAIYSFPEKDKVIDEIMKQMNNVLTNDFDKFETSFDEIKKSIYDYLQKIFGSIPNSIFLIENIIKEYSNFINFYKECHSVFSFDDDKLSKDIISKTIEFVKEKCDKYDMKVSVNYYSNEMKWFAFYARYISPIEESEISNESFKYVVMTFLVRNVVEKEKKYIECMLL